MIHGLRHERLLRSSTADNRYCMMPQKFLVIMMRMIKLGLEAPGGYAFSALLHIGLDSLRRMPTATFSRSVVRLISQMPFPEVDVLPILGRRLRLKLQQLILCIASTWSSLKDIGRPASAPTSQQRTLRMLRASLPII